MQTSVLLRTLALISFAGATLSAHALAFRFGGVLDGATSSGLEAGVPYSNPYDVSGITFSGYVTDTQVVVRLFKDGLPYAFPGRVFPMLGPPPPPSGINLPNALPSGDPGVSVTYAHALTGTPAGFSGSYRAEVLHFAGSGAIARSETAGALVTSTFLQVSSGYSEDGFDTNDGALVGRVTFFAPGATPGPAAALPFALLALRRRRRA